MPAVAVVGAAVSIGAGLAATSAVVSGLLITGGVLSGVAAITGNEKLGKIGAVLSLVGGGIQGFQALSAQASLATAADDLTAVANAADAADDVAGISRAASDLTLGDDLAKAASLTDELAEPLAEVAKAAPQPLQALPPTEVTKPLVEPLSVETAKPVTTTSAPLAEATAAQPVTDASGGLQATQAPAPIDQTGLLGEFLKKLGTNTVELGKTAVEGIKKNPELAKLAAGTGNGLITSYQKQKLADEQARIAEQNRARYNQSILGQRRI